MPHDENGKGNITRRQVLVGTGAVIASGALASSTGLALPTPKSILEITKVQSGVALEDQIWDFEKMPEPVPDSKILETLTADIVVIGSGGAGLPCTLAAVETGAKVITLEKLPKATGATFYGRAIGAWYGFSKSKLTDERGIKLDVKQMVGAQVRASLWRCDQRQINKVAKYGPLVESWWQDVLAEEGIDSDQIPIERHAEMNQQELPTQAHSRVGQYVYWHGHQHVIPTTRVEAAFEKYLKDKFDFEILYETPARQLIKEANRITGVIAQNSKGYIKIKAKNGVILCTGGYEGNKEMMKKYLPESGAYLEVFGKKTNTGDGYLMAQWVGARMDPWPHCPMTWDGMNPEALEKLHFDYVGIARQPWLYVNVLGERFMNEDAPFGSIGKSMFMQPRSMMWTVFDDKWRDDDIGARLKGTVCRRMTRKVFPLVLPYNTKEATEKMIAAGIILKANSIDELAALMLKNGPALGTGTDLDVDRFKAEIARYNQLARAGDDEDFGKDPQALVPCDTPPFYAVRTTVGILVTQAGPLVNDKFQVVNKEGKVIQGLYAAGNSCGGFNQYEYSMDADIGSLGRCCITGYLAAKYAAGVKV